MDVIERVFEGTDLIIPSQVIEDMGLKPGDALVIRPKTDLEQSALDRAERTRRLRALEDLYGSWSVEEEAEFDRARQELLWRCEKVRRSG